MEQVRYVSARASRSNLCLCTAGLTVLTSPSNLMSSHCATDADRLLTGSHILSEIRVEGTFSVAEVHSWISNCLPEMPDRYSNTLETLNSLPIVCEITALVICGQASNILDAAGLQMTTMKSYSSQHLWKQYSVVSTGEQNHTANDAWKLLVVNPGCCLCVVVAAKMKLSSSAIPFLHCLY